MERLTRLATAGGSPNGFHETKTRIQPVSRILPKPPKKYRKIVLNQCVLAGDGAFLPYSRCLLSACSVERPAVDEVVSRFSTSKGAMVCHSRSVKAVTRIVVSSCQPSRVMREYLTFCRNVPC